MMKTIQERYCEMEDINKALYEACAAAYTAIGILIDNDRLGTKGVNLYKQLKAALYRADGKEVVK